MNKIKSFFIKNGHLLLYFLAIFLIMFPLLKNGYVFLTDYISGPMVKFGNDFIGTISKFFGILFDYDYAQKIIITLSFCSVLFGAKKVVENFVENKYLVFFISLFALLNPYTYERTGYGQFGIIIAYGALLFVFGFILRYIFNFKDKEYKTIKSDKKIAKVINKIFGINSNIIYSAIFSGIALYFSPHFIFFLAVPLIILFMFLLKNFKEINKKALISIFGVSVILVCLINFNIFAGIFNKNKDSAISFSETAISHQDLLAFATSDVGAFCIDNFSNDCKFSSSGRVEKNANGKEIFIFNKPNRSFGAWYNVLSMSGFWGKDQFRFKSLTDNAFIFSLSYLLVFMLSVYGVSKMFAHFKLKKTNFLSWYFIGSFVLVAILAVGVRSNVFRGFNLFLFDHLPFYSGLREPQKWVAVLCSLYLIFISVAVKDISENYDFKKKKRNFIILCAGLFIVFFLRAPYTFFAFSNQLEATDYPSDWYGVDKVLWEDQNKCENKKVLFLPWHLYMHFRFMGQIKFHGNIIGNRITANPASIFFRCPVVYGTNMEWGGIFDSVVDENDKAFNVWYQSELKNYQVLKDKEIGYILVAKEVDYQAFDTLLTLDYVELIKETDNFYLYKIIK